MKLLKLLSNSKNARDLKKLSPEVAEINRIEETLHDLTDDQLKAKTDEFRERLANGETTDDIAYEAFAVAKNACRRLKGTTFDLLGHDKEWVEIPYDVQLLGGLAMHRHRIAEMATGEGKTLVATLPTYLNALTGKGVHIVTVNDYLARRDAEWMAQLYRYLGLTVGCIQSKMKPDERRDMYNCDITYGTNSEFGFDYLRDNMRYDPSEYVQRGHFYAIIDEIDSVLIDEARTPLIISGPMDHSAEEVYRECKPDVERLIRGQNRILKDLFKRLKKALEEDDEQTAMYTLYQLKQGNPSSPELLSICEDVHVLRLMEKGEMMMLSDTNKDLARRLREELYFTMEERNHEAALTDIGRESMAPNDPDAYQLPDLPTILAELDGDTSIDEEERARRVNAIQEDYATKSRIMHATDQLIKAYTLYLRDKQYIVENNKVVIVDENTGRKMEGRRWSDGLHQAVEAKEGTAIEKETQTWATITIQNYFRMYEKLAGMTGTAETEADEFMQTYKLDVLVVPTNRPTRRVDYNDPIYRTQREKYEAVVGEIKDRHKMGQPILVGTITVDSSEKLSKMLDRAKIPHAVLNAKHHEQESEIVSRAGQKGAVTIATNMAGRGTDIKLGKGVINWSAELHDSYLGLDDNYEGDTLRELLIEKPCGLYVIGLERNDSRRIDRQLRGRCSRQGDPGCTRFFVSMEDKLMRQFGSDRISGMLNKIGVQEGEAMEHPWLNKSIERAQRKVEQVYFQSRKKTLEYDDVMNRQREIVYDTRAEILRSENPRANLLEMIEDHIAENVDATYVPDNRDIEEGWLPANRRFYEWLLTTFPVGVKFDQVVERCEDLEGLKQFLIQEVNASYERKCQLEDPNDLVGLERYILLSAIDQNWQEYLREFDAVRQGVGLMGYAQKDPLVEFKHRAFDLFNDLMDKIRGQVMDNIFRYSTQRSRDYVQAAAQTFIQEGGDAPAPEAAMVAEQAEQGRDAAMKAALTPKRRAVEKVGRNDPCSCGSGKKYKKCCGK